MLTRKMVEKLACDMLDRDGIHGIWDLQLATISATEEGEHNMATSLLEVAEAAERLWAARDTAKPGGARAFRAAAPLSSDPTPQHRSRAV